MNPARRSVLLALLVLCTGCGSPIVRRNVVAPEPVELSPSTVEWMAGTPAERRAAPTEADLQRVRVWWSRGDLPLSLAIAEIALARCETEDSPERVQALALESCVMAWHALEIDAGGSASARAAALYNRGLETFLRALDHLPALEPEPFKADAPLRQLAACAASPPVASVLGLEEGSELVVRLDWLEKMGWPDSAIEHLELASDYVLAGEGRDEGNAVTLGVPLIASRPIDSKLAEPGTAKAKEERVYPPGISIPLTAVLTASAGSGELRLRFVSPYRPRGRAVSVGTRTYPSTRELFKPLAVFLDRISLAEKGILWFLNPGRARESAGIYMVEPWTPDKIPVIFVHGLASSPYTWIEAHRELTSKPEIERSFQFWYFLYPSLDPFVDSGALLQEHLAGYEELYIDRELARASDRYILIGHSMGGLVSALQTVDFVFEGEFGGRSESITFHPNPQIPFMVSVATPFAGSDLASGLARAAARSLSGNPITSIDFLAMDSKTHERLREAMQTRSEAPSPRTLYYGFVGDVPGKRGDTVVPLESALAAPFDWIQTVPASHFGIQSHSRMLEPLAEILRRYAQDRGAR